MEYRICGEPYFSPVTVKIKLETPSELLWFAEAMNISAAAISNRLESKGYQSINTHIDKNNLCKKIDDICRTYNLTPTEEP